MRHSKAVAALVITAVFLSVCPAVVSAGEAADFWLKIEAESVPLSGRVTTFDDPSASGGQYIYAPSGSPLNTASGELNARYTFSVPKTDAYSVWIRLNAVNQGSDSFFLKEDESEVGFELISLPVTNGWEWVNLKAPVLTAGEHTFSFKYREANCRIDAWMISGEADIIPMGIAGTQSSIRPERRYHFNVPAGTRVMAADETLANIAANAADPRYAQMLAVLYARAEGRGANPPPYDFITTDKNDGWLRGTSMNVGYLAAAYRLRSDAAKRAAILTKLNAWVAGICAYPYWGRENVENCDLVAGHMLYAMAIAYNWCGSALNAEVRETLYETLQTKGKAMYRATWNAMNGRLIQQPLQNHRWICLTGLAAAGFAIADTDPQGLDWLQRACDLYEETLFDMGGDGASHEGIMYWAYGMASLLRFTDIARAAGVDYYGTSEWLQNTADYGIAHVLPENGLAVNDVINFGDSEPDNAADGNEMPAVLRKLAREYGVAEAQTVADLLDAKRLKGNNADLCGILWYDPSIEPATLAGYKPDMYFGDMGIITSRGGEGAEQSVVSLICAPYMGHRVWELNTAIPPEDWGAPHVHPDRGHVSVYSNGDRILTDDGYSNKYTENHNTLLVDGAGQLGGGGGAWFALSEELVAAKPQILQTRFDGGVTYAALDAAPAYPSSAALAKFRRHVVYIKPNILIVADDISTPKTAQLRYFSGGEITTENGVITINGANTTTHYQSFTGGASVSQVTVRNDKTNAEKTVKAITVDKPSGSAEFLSVSAFAWANKGETPPRVRAVPTGGNTWVITTDTKAFELDLENNTLVKTFAVAATSRTVSGVVLQNRLTAPLQGAIAYIAVRGGGNALTKVYADALDFTALGEQVLPLPPDAQTSEIYVWNKTSLEPLMEVSR
ncbi:MAG: DUF4962 domain-containing protein [Clostridiales bacterium]|jgi:hypothetical protein|nr:DUF4962 domain-containing protein [Clostridiales bacterium]